MKFRMAVTMMVLLGTAMVSLAQTDTLKGDPEDESTPRRKANAEWFVGLSQATYTYDGTTFNGETEIVVQGIQDTRLLAMLGYGGHIPLATLGRITTLWFVPAAALGVGISKSSSGSEAPFSGMSIDLSVPVHVTVGYGALRRKSIAWGIEGGVGINVARRFAQEAFTVAPSAMIDISYSPRAVYRLRIMTDLIAASIGETSTYQTWSVCLVVGFGD